MSSTTSTSSTPTARPSHKVLQQPPSDSASRIPVTPAVLRSIFASSRSPHEERSISRVAFFRFAGFLLSCIAISMVAARNRGIRNSAALLGVVS
ncbi:uncharacterized protein LACBIDRAFT_311601 [Laccaria bicolor S238N-H82]|uniref:Predicted protein n=1 Tax=Laccaria bicolor (strain S238N-H82 / ATCC MYA-4686) TaxID=486041 RepID=B0CXT1_LACBS|nr:uncharacterized protein LACBIDRAFT_311601 [Laccaria bicolor S238N-H82]EDR12315.1 predicted protein [Laccaria bicolor S238N-H82]|eukprot:XP_001876579.1 predicted protein [Laccaria bicolor S238N-H82]